MTKLAQVGSSLQEAAAAAHSHQKSEAIEEGHVVLVVAWSQARSVCKQRV